MKYGICIGIDKLDWVCIAAESGADYVEANFTQLAQADEETYAAFKNALEGNMIACEAANGFVPGTLPTTGEDVDDEALKAFVEKGMQRAQELGIRVVVFGSGASRSLKEGTGYRRGFEQLAKFLREIAGPVAEKYGISIAIEPLCPAESNIINTVKEGVMLAAASGRTNVSGLGDLYHMAIIGDTGDDLRALRGSILHTHISNPALNEVRRRRYPADVTEYDYADFIAAAEYAGCPRCSIEAGCEDFLSEAPRAIAVLRRL